MLIQAWDVSPNHCGAVELESSTGEMIWHSFATTGPQAHARKPGSVLLPELAKAGKQMKSCDRIMRLHECFTAWASRPNLAIVAVEDYAMGASQGAHFIGEIGGVARLAILSAGVKLRLWGLKSIKKFWTTSGNATKDQMKEFTQAAGVNFAYSAQVNEDLCDSYALARLMLAEIALSNGFNPTLLAKHQREVLCRKLDDGVLAWQRPYIGG